MALPKQLERAAPSASRRRRRARRVTWVVLGLALGASCPLWPEDIAWVCVVIARVAEVLHAVP